LRMVVDAVGSTAFLDSPFKSLGDAGGQVSWYHPLRWHSWPRAK